jgi:hypothetical protein
VIKYFFNDHPSRGLSVLEEKWKEPNLVDDAKSLLRILGSNHLLFPGSFQQKVALKEIEKEVRRFIRKNYIIRYKIGISEIDELTNKIIEKLRYHAEK